MKIKRQDFNSWIYTAFLFLNTAFFFFGSYNYIPKIIVIACSWFLLGIIVCLRKYYFRSIFLTIFCYLFLLQFSKLFRMDLFLDTLDFIYPLGVAQILFLLYFLGEDKNTVFKSIDKYINIFVLIAIPSIILYVAMLLNNEFNYSIIYLGERGFRDMRNYYNLAIFIDRDFSNRYGNFIVLRLCGMFEEPGMLGTITSFLLAVDIIAFRDKWLRKTILFILGILSLSLGFYIPLFFIIIFLILKKRATLVKHISSVICILMLSLILLYIVPKSIKDAFSQILLPRFAISDTGIWVGDSRSVYTSMFSEYLKSGNLLQLAIGNGGRANQLDKAASYSSYHAIIYDAGFIGFIMALLFAGYFLVWLPLKNKEYLISLLTISSLASIYHRPDFYSPHILVMYAAIYLIFKPKKYTFIPKYSIVNNNQLIKQASLDAKK